MNNVIRNNCSKIKHQLNRQQKYAAFPAWLLAALTGIGMLPVFPSLAASEEPLTPQLEEITVVSVRSLSDLNSTPRSISIINSQGLRDAIIRNSFDLQAHVPGLVVSSNTALGQPYIRGIGSDLIGVGGDASVATYIDGAYQPRAVGALQDVFDLEKIEVLKGPSGTLYGRNATGGTIHYVSNKPHLDDGYSGYGIGSFGNYRAWLVEGASTIPLVPGKSVLRIAGRINRHDGYGENLGAGTDGNSEKREAVRLHLLTALSDQWTLLTTADYGHQNDTRSLGFVLGPAPSIARDLLGGLVSSNVRISYADEPGYARVSRTGISAALEGTIADYQIKSATAWRRTNGSLGFDMDATNIPFFTNYPAEKSNSVYQDIQISHRASSRWNWIFGATYLHEDANFFLDLHLPLLGVTSRPNSSISTNAFSGFGQIHWNVLKDASLTLGARISHEEKEYALDLVENGVLSASQNSKKSWTDISPQMTLSITPTRYSHYYLTIAKGFKSGGFNSSSIQPPYKPETLWSYEIGTKLSGSENRWNLNLAAFYYDYRDIQINRLEPGSAFPIIDNATTARTFGIEVDSSMNLTDRWQFSIHAAWLDGRYRNFHAIDENNPGAGSDQSGNPMTLAPTWTLTFATDYRLIESEKWSVTIHGDYRYQSRVYFSPFADRVSSQGAYSLASVRITLRQDDGHWEAAVYLRNLTNVTYLENVIRADNLIGALMNYGPPRIWGIELKYSW